MAEGSDEEQSRYPTSFTPNSSVASVIQGCTKSDIDLVRKEYKRYKRKKPPPDFNDVIDFEDSNTFRERVEQLELKNFPHSNHGLRCAKEWKFFGLKSCPGFMFIVNPFVDGAQQYWTRRCIKDYPIKPNKCNLDVHMKLPEDKSVWELSQSNDEYGDLMQKLRWTHLGYEFDYNVVNYKPDDYYGFPKDLASLMQHIAFAIGYPGYVPEAGIINYYPLGSSMGGHTDHYELDLSWPLVSVSFGQSAVFLIGGRTRNIQPTALYIRSGDILIMSGESRAAFHAVPRIIKVAEQDEPPNCLKWKPELFCKPGEACKKESLNNSVIEETEQSGIEELRIPETSCCCYENTCFERKEKTRMTLSEDDWKPFSLYLSKTRININVRQVHEQGKTLQTLT